MSNFPFTPRQSTDPFAVDILVFPEFSLMSLAATMEPLRAANRVSGQQLYTWRLLSLDGTPVVSTSAASVAVKDAFDDTDVRDTLILIASQDDRRAEKKMHSALRRLTRRRVPIGGVEAASWTLAAAGLLDGRRATTHWEDLEFFAESFPNITVVPDRFVIDGPVFTTGGATPALDMMLALITAQHGMNLALNAASVFIYDQQRTGTDPQPVVSVGRLAATHPRVARAIRMMEENLSEPKSIPTIAKAVGLSHRMLELQFRTALALTPQTYYLDLRLNAARRLMLQSPLDVSVVADASGFSSAATLARAFRRTFGQSPTEARQKAQNAIG